MAIAVASASFLSGCGDSKPDDELAAKTVRPYAEQGLMMGIELTDFKRDNGWVDTDSPNRYKVQYTYNYRLSKPLAEVALQSAQAFKNEYDASQKNRSGFVGGFSTWAQSMQLSMTAEQWIDSQGAQFAKRRDGFLSNCEPCVAYWNQPGTEEDVSTRRYTFVTAWSRLEALGFKDDAKAGDKLPLSAWAAFIKTEKGWKPAS
ncbi:hypothetical protein GTP81_26135 [Rugamonas sp. FT107W]|uniref:Uncharacterized protein n=1 Tax=Duganella vulcania TaxID=2692166 RepID=A0A845HN82_9BURK|nr:hypothetical protein [Duganella vulcania]MYN20228.1 hypothetical protein [Duganella vulcania]